MNKKFSFSTAELFSPLYSQEKLFSKISNVGRKAGIKVIYSSLVLYYALMDKSVPLKDKITVVGALGYFICPIDAIPDILPGGYADDMGALVLALKTIWGNVTCETKAKAEQRLKQWFDNVSEEDLQLF
ncbi:MAG: DUF1232 domain-containing protein [Bacteroides sp.]|nr:DUF1232 domain-containing protein [Bacteroidales bacterium]MBD5335884.1 DUF1232 domain-containing protein [Bacteroides sp.]